MYNAESGHRDLKEVIKDLAWLDCKSFRNDLKKNDFNEYLINDAVYYLNRLYDRVMEDEREIAKAHGLK